ncbi:PF14066 family protein [Leptospira santarosai str. 2000030832]|nr:PF14066 family protein [Leptospira santarosai str. 2000030832]
MIDNSNRNFRGPKQVFSLNHDTLDVFIQQRSSKRMNNSNSDRKELSLEQSGELLRTLKARFEKNRNRHKELDWTKIQTKLETTAKKLWSLNEMERTGGEPDVVGYEKKTGEYIFYDCSEESPKGRRSVCYDREALESRKEHKPKDNAVDMAVAMGIELLTEEQYRDLQKFGKFDTKTSSWVKTPSDIRKLGGAIFADFRYGHVFVYHNSAESYYAVRAFRGSLRI